MRGIAPEEANFVLLGGIIKELIVDYIIYDLWLHNQIFCQSPGKVEKIQYNGKDAAKILHLDIEDSLQRWIERFHLSHIITADSVRDYSDKMRLELRDLNKGRGTYQKTVKKTMKRVREVLKNGRLEKELEKENEDRLVGPPSLTL